MSRLQLVLRGIRRHQGNALSRTPRQPITLSHLRTLHHYIHHHYSGRNALMLWSSDTDAFFGLLRASEFTSPTTSEYAPSTLMFHHVTVTYDPSAVRLYLPKSKTDQYSTGSTIHLFPQPQPFCPVTATTAYMRSHPTNFGPFHIRQWFFPYTQIYCRSSTFRFPQPTRSQHTFIPYRGHVFAGCVRSPGLSN